MATDIQEARQARKRAKAEERIEELEEALRSVKEDILDYMPASRAGSTLLDIERALLAGDGSDE